MMVVEMSVFLETIFEEEDVFEDAVSELDSVYGDAESGTGEKWANFWC